MIEVLLLLMSRCSITRFFVNDSKKAVNRSVFFEILPIVEVFSVGVSGIELWKMIMSKVNFDILISFFKNSKKQAGEFP
jgi:hypothetical protein